MSYLQKLRDSRKSNFDQLTKKLESADNNSQNKEDERFWKPSVDKSGNGFATIRFLPPLDGEDDPWVSYWHHSFKGPGGWYINNSLTTIGKPDPVAEMNRKKWNSGGKGSPGQQFVSGTPGNPGSKRKLSYISNILVVDDPAKPENNGKVFLYRYGKKIWDKIKEASHPTFPDQTPFNPFDILEAANLKLRIRKEDGYQNYDSSVWASDIGPLYQDEEKMERVLGSLHSLQEFISPDRFKTYNELKERLDVVMGLVEVKEEDDPRPAKTPEYRSDDEEEDAPWNEAAKESPPVEDDEEDAAFFARLQTMARK